MTKRRTRAKTKKRGTTGRLPTGLRGEKMSEYPRLTVRVPLETVNRLRDLAERLGLKQWRVLHDAIQAYDPAGGTERKSGGLE